MVVVGLNKPFGFIVVFLPRRVYCRLLTPSSSSSWLPPPPAPPPAPPPPPPHPSPRFLGSIKRDAGACYPSQRNLCVCQTSGPTLERTSCGILQPEGLGFRV
jgi:hypothetical protein